MDYIMIDSDDWIDAGTEYRLVSMSRRPDSTATDLILEHNGKTTQRVVAYHSIRWIKKEQYEYINN